MRWQRTVHMIDAHCEGEVGRVVTGGVLALPGATMAERLNYLNTVDDGLRRMLVQEPRGAPAGSVNLLQPPCRPGCDAGFIVLQPDQAHAMSGSNAICVTTVLLETGMVAMVEPETIVNLDTAAGQVEAKATCVDGRCRSVSLAMTPAYVERLDHELKTEPWGPIKIDICFGGVFYALVDVDQIGLKIAPGNAHLLAAAGMKLRQLARAQFDVSHPTEAAISGIAYVMFRDRDDDGAVRTCTTMWPGRLDRSPCGTGSSAQLAAMHARGELGPGESFTTRSTIGSTFKVTHNGTTDLAGREAVLPIISGRAWIHGMHQTGVDPDDPYGDGFMMSDVWGPLSGNI